MEDQTDSNKWTRQEKTFLRKNYTKMTAVEIAAALGKTPAAIYNAAQRYKIRCKSHWQTREIQYLIDSVGRIEIKHIAAHLFRSKAAVSEKLKSLDIKVNDNNDVTIKSICRRCNLSDFLIYQAIKNGELEILGRQVGGTRSFYFDISAVRDYVLAYHPYKQVQCYECQAPVKGDIYCSAHRPYDMKPPPPPVTKILVKASAGITEYQKQLRAALATIRQQEGLTQEELSLLSNHGRMWLGNLERGKPVVTNECIDSILKPIGWELELRFVKKGEFA